MTANTDITTLAHAVQAQPTEQVAILWLASDGVADGDAVDRATVLEVDDYTMRVRIGWQGHTPLVMLFRRQIREQVRVTGLGAPGEDYLPMVRESNGIPLNWQD